MMRLRDGASTDGSPSAYIIDNGRRWLPKCIHKQEKDNKRLCIVKTEEDALRMYNG